MQQRKHTITIEPTPDSVRTVATLRVTDEATFWTLVTIEVKRRHHMGSNVLDARCVLQGLPSAEGFGFWSVSLNGTETDFRVLMLLADVLGYQTAVEGEWTPEFAAADQLLAAMQQTDLARSAA